jgi:hypothetical protein
MHESPFLSISVKIDISIRAATITGAWPTRAGILLGPSALTTSSPSGYGLRAGESPASAHEDDDGAALKETMATTLWLWRKPSSSIEVHLIAALQWRREVGLRRCRKVCGEPGPKDKEFLSFFF